MLPKGMVGMLNQGKVNIFDQNQATLPAVHALTARDALQPTGLLHVLHLEAAGIAARHPAAIHASLEVKDGCGGLWGRGGARRTPPRTACPKTGCSTADKAGRPGFPVIFAK